MKCKILSRGAQSHIWTKFENSLKKLKLVNNVPILNLYGDKFVPLVIIFAGTRSPAVDNLTNFGVFVTTQ